MKVNLDNEFYCTSCGNRQMFSIPRRKGKERKCSHLKKMYCFNCKEEHNFVEINPFATVYTVNDFKLEFEYGNFKNGERFMPYGLFKNELVKKGIL